VGFGVLGAGLPVRPTTPIVLLATACAARASARFSHGLLDNPFFGPTIRPWRRDRSRPAPTTWIAIELIMGTRSTPVVVAVQRGPLQAALAAFGVALATPMARIPPRDRPSGRP
jgi:uncharacterized membrane protein YbaN (DUF454 family)